MSHVLPKFHISEVSQRERFTFKTTLLCGDTPAKLGSLEGGVPRVLQSLLGP